MERRSFRLWGWCVLPASGRQPGDGRDERHEPPDANCPRPNERAVVHDRFGDQLHLPTGIQAHAGTDLGAGDAEEHDDHDRRQDEYADGGTP